jgi:hypothetical protein
MQTTSQHIRQHLLNTLGYFEQVPLKPSFESLKETEWDKKFEQLMRNRLIMGALRYGLFTTKNSTTEQNVLSLKNKVLIYEQTGNLECLVDIANVAQVEFIHSNHPNKHFNATDDKDHVT